MSTPIASNADEPPQQDNHQLSSFSSLPEEIVLNCLARVPRNCHLNLASVSRTLRSLVRSPELHRLRSLLQKNSLYLYYRIDNQWLTLRQIQKNTSTTTTEYCLVPTMFPSHPCVKESRAVSLGPEIYFVGSRQTPPSTDLWILDTRSGKFTQGPSMKVPRSGVHTLVGVIDGKIYVIGVVRLAEPNEEIQVEVFEPETKIWKFAGHEKVPPRPWCQQFIASLERKIYMVEFSRIGVYNPTEATSEGLVYMASEKLVGKKTRKLLRDAVDYACVVEKVLYAHFTESGLMWFDTKLSVWRKLVSRDGKKLCLSYVHAMAEYKGKLAVFKYLYDDIFEYTKSVEIFLFALDRVGERICGTIEWSGIVASIPESQFCNLSHCLVASQ